MPTLDEQLRDLNEYQQSNRDRWIKILTELEEKNRTQADIIVKLRDENYHLQYHSDSVDVGERGVYEGGQFLSYMELQSRFKTQRETIANYQEQVKERDQFISDQERDKRELTATIARQNHHISKLVARPDAVRDLVSDS
jgi:hypothetical protein